MLRKNGPPESGQYTLPFLNTPEGARNKKFLICDALNSLVHRLPYVDIFFASLEYIALFTQKPLIFALWEKSKKHDAKKCIDVFLRDSAYLYKYRKPGASPESAIKKMIKAFQGATAENDLIPLPAMPSPAPERAFYISVYKIPEYENGDNHVWEGPFIDRSATRSIAKLLGRPENFLTEAYRKRLIESTTYWIKKRKKRRKETSALGYFMEEELYARLINPFFEVLNRLYSDLGYPGGSVEVKDEKGLDIPNLFFMLRAFTRDQSRYDGLFSYDVRMLPLSDFREKILKMTGLKRSEDKNEYVKAIKMPADLNTRTLADFVFENELMLFATKQHVEKLNKKFKKCDENDYQDLVDEIQFKIIGTESSILGIPIHVCGVPWIVAYTVRSGEFSQDWHQAYLLYRTVIPNMSEAIRRESLTIYLETLRDIILEELTSRITDFNEKVTKINKRLNELAMVYPYPQLVLNACREPQPGLRVFKVNDRGIFSVQMIDNRYYGSEIADCPIKEESLFDYLDEALKSFNSFDALNFNTLMGHTSHFIKKPLLYLVSLLGRNEIEAAKKTAQGILLLQHTFDVLTNPEKASKEPLVKYSINEFTEWLNSKFMESVNHCCLIYSPDHQLASKMVASKIARPGNLTGSEEVCLFQDHAFHLMEGLLTNVIRHIDGPPNLFSISLKCDGKGRLLLCMNNPVSGHLNDWKDQVYAFNYAFEGIIGISQIHWINRAFWENSPFMSDFYSPPRWTLAEKNNSMILEAVVPIGRIA